MKTYTTMYVPGRTSDSGAWFVVYASSGRSAARVDGGFGAAKELCREMNRKS